jgi:ligand-binding sensor domain-containing protein
MRKIAILAWLVLSVVSAGCSLAADVQDEPVVWTTYVPDTSRKLISLTIDRTGVKWVGTEGDGALVLSPNNQQWMPISTPGRAEANTVTDITIDSDSNIWIATLIGVAVVSPEGQTTATYTSGNDLPSASLQDVAIDSAGNPWFATWGGGVSYLNRASGEWVRYTNADGLLDDRVATIRIDQDGNKWIGTQIGVSRLGPSGEWTNYGPAAGFGQAAVWAMVGDVDGSLWCATQGAGVIVLDAQGQNAGAYTTQTGLPDNTVNDVLIDTGGNKWFATNNGLARLSRDTSTLAVFTTAHGLGSNVVTELSLDPAGNIWAATYGGGLSVYQPPQ